MMVAPPKPPILGLPPVSQIGFVVPDLAVAVAAFTPMFGPFATVRFENKDCDYRGGRADCVIDVAFGHSGDIEIEIIQPVSGNGAHREFVEAGGNGLHHVQYRFTDIVPVIARFKDEGYDCIWHKRMGPNVAVAYLARPDISIVFEVVEPFDRKARSKNWSK